MSEKSLFHSPRVYKWAGRLMWLVPVLLFALAIVFLTTTASAQTETTNGEVDDGDFSHGDEGAAPNTDSEAVPGLGMALPTYGGTGCPQGTINAVLSPDQRTLSVLFDQYIARAGGTSAGKRERVDCQIQVPFQVPAGYRVQVVKLDYRGFASLPGQSRAVFGAGFRYLEPSGAPVPSPRMMRRAKMQGPLQTNFVLTSVLRGRGWSPCGKPFILAAESFLRVQSQNPAEEALSTIDSLDAVEMPVKFSLRWKRCQGDENERPGRRRRI